MLKTKNLSQPTGHCRWAAETRVQNFILVDHVLSAIPGYGGFDSFLSVEFITCDVCLFQVSILRRPTRRRPTSPHSTCMVTAPNNLCNLNNINSKPGTGQPRSHIKNVANLEEHRKKTASL